MKAIYDFFGYLFDFCMMTTTMMIIMKTTTTTTTGYNALPSPPRLIRWTHKQRDSVTDAERHNAFSAVLRNTFAV